MPCHWGHREKHIVTQSSATASQCLSAVGCAEATRYIQGRNLPGCDANGDEITYVSLGEGSTSEGEFWESLNTACRLHLPLLYLVADNGYAISVRAEDQSPAPISEMVRGFRGLAITKIDGRDYFQARHFGARAVARVRAAEGPGLIHAKVTRPYSHSAADTQSKYRTSEDLADEAAHDPILVLEHELVKGGVITPEDVERIRDEAKTIVMTAAKEALAAERPDPASVLDHVYVRPPIPDEPKPDTDGEVVAFGESIRRTLHEVMAADERIRVFGEDVADAPEALIDQVEGKGGVFGTTAGLQRTFGIARCFNTPLAEANIVGRAVGQAVRGLRPCPEIQFFDYIWPAMTQIKTEAATIRWRSNGALVVPGGAARPHRRLPHGRRDLAQPVRRVDLRSRARAHRDVPVTGARCRRHVARRVPLRGSRVVPRAQAPAAPAVHEGPVSRARLRRAARQGRGRAGGQRSHDRHVRRHGRTLTASGRATRRRVGGDHRPALSGAVGPRARRRVRSRRQAA